MREAQSHTGSGRLPFYPTADKAMRKLVPGACINRDHGWLAWMAARGGHT